jgi:hypothetical protein
VNVGAKFSPCRKWRYLLWRQWDASKPWANFCLMNPSTADEENNDPTVERQQRRAAKWRELNYMDIGGVMVTNVFAWRETDSDKLEGLIEAGYNIIGPENDKTIIAAAKMAKIVVCGWGNPGHTLLDRGPQLLRMFDYNGIRPHALKINQNGAPQHPLYISYATLPVWLEERKAA